jgi:endogenous inhibitor of DNA gyrase (YacG/DUF329 family)
MKDDPSPACPICSRPVTPQHRPFCSPRCQQVDLARWLTGSYRITQDDPDSAPEFVPDPVGSPSADDDADATNDGR